VRKILEDTLKEMEPVALEMAGKLDDEFLAKMKQGGNIEINEADKAAFVAASKAVYEEFAKQVKGGQELIDKALGLGKSS
jgi:TRAP-type C4-dicarboxylate transport system substrate-binding protein